MTLFKKSSWNFTRGRFFDVYIIYDCFCGLCRYMVKRKFAFNFDFFLYCFYTSVKGNFFNSGVIVSFSDDIEIPSGQLKRFSEPVIDPNFYWKLKWHPFVLITIYPFQATLYFLVYYYFYLKSTVYILSKIIWSYNQR